MRQDLQRANFEKNRAHNIALIAGQMQRPIEEVGRIYDSQLVRLIAEAKVFEYLEVLAIRSTRETLEARRKPEHGKTHESLGPFGETSNQNS